MLPTLPAQAGIVVASWPRCTFPPPHTYPTPRTHALSSLPRCHAAVCPAAAMAAPHRLTLTCADDRNTLLAWLRSELARVNDGADGFLLSACLPNMERPEGLPPSRLGLVAGRTKGLSVTAMGAYVPVRVRGRCGAFIVQARTCEREPVCCSSAPGAMHGMPGAAREEWHADLGDPPGLAWRPAADRRGGPTTGQHMIPACGLARLDGRGSPRPRGLVRRWHKEHTWCCCGAGSPDTLLNGADRAKKGVGWAAVDGEVVAEPWQ